MVSLRMILLVIFFNLIPHSMATQHCYPGTSRCYWMSTAADADWSTARANCQLQGGDLAVMETEELWDFVVGKIR